MQAQKQPPPPPQKSPSPPPPAPVRQLIDKETQILAPIPNLSNTLRMKIIYHELETKFISEQIQDSILQIRNEQRKAAFFIFEILLTDVLMEHCEQALLQLIEEKPASMEVPEAPSMVTELPSEPFDAPSSISTPSSALTRLPEIPVPVILPMVEELPPVPLDSFSFGFSLQ